MRDAVKLPMYFDSYKSTIEHERHFRDEVSALEYAENLQQTGLVAVIAVL